MRTLLVEDDRAQRESLKDALESYGLNVTAVADAESGLLAHLRQPFDLLVVDWVMPEMDGLQLCLRVRSLPGGDAPYILVVTGRDRACDLAEVLNAGADDYIAKPVEFGLLETRILIAQRRIESDFRHRQAREALARSEADFQRVIERCPLGVFAHRDGKIVYANVAAERTLGVDRQALDGTPLERFIPPSYRRLVKDRSERFERTDVPPPPMEMEIQRADGSRAAVRMIPATRALLRGDRASFTMLEDVTERKRAERELRLTQFAVDHASDAAVWVRADGTLAYVNHAACTMTGFDREELLSCRFDELDIMLGADGWPAMFRELVAQTRIQREGKLRRQDGGEVPVEISANLLSFDGEQLIVAFARDLTERHRMQASLQKADRLASVGSLAAGVAHEINNPLAYVIANLELLTEDVERWGSGEQPPMDEVRRTLLEATEGAHRVRRIVGDLKSFARADDDELHAVDVADVLDTAIDIAGNELRHRARVEREYGGVPTTWGNEGRLTQVFVNLLVNAAHAIPEESDGDHRIGVRAFVDRDGWICVEIEDSGIGIEPKIIDHIFDPFFTTKPQGMGTGLGLSICHGIVTGLGGRIEVASQMGRGSTFRVKLPPADRPAPRAEPALWQEAPTSVYRKLRILVVDDEPLICEGVKRALSGHLVEVARSGRDAIRLCESGDFDLILCDVMMPDVSGMDVYGRIRNSRPGIEARFVFMTGGAFTPKTRAFLESVANEQIIKPFSLRELRLLVAKRAEG